MSLVARRLGAFTLASALAVTGVTLLPGPAQAAPDPRPVAQGADWLNKQLTSYVVIDNNGEPDRELSMDIALALHEVGVVDTAGAVSGSIRSSYWDYLVGGPALYAGIQAKALVLAQITSTGPASYQAAVRAALEERVSDDPDFTGRIENFNEVPVDTADVLGQSFATRALVVADSDEADEALAFLLEQQCADGGFRESFDPKLDTEQGCDPADSATYGDRISATSSAVLNLQAISGESGVAAVLTSARNWLRTQQNEIGSFGVVPTASSTGLAARALGASAEASSAARWVRDRQVDDTYKCGAAAWDVGAIAPDDEILDDVRSNGVGFDEIATLIETKVRNASALALPALEFLEAEPQRVLKLTGPSGYVRGGATATYSVSGAAPGGKLCLRPAGPFKYISPYSTRSGTATGAGSAALSVRLPEGTELLPSGSTPHHLTVIDRNGNHSEFTNHVLGPKALKVKAAAKKVKRGKSVRVTVTGLAAQEPVVLRYKGVHVATGKATAAGTFSRTVRVGKATGMKKFTVTGRFPDIRKGATTIRVIR